MRNKFFFPNLKSGPLLFPTVGIVYFTNSDCVILIYMFFIAGTGNTF